MAQSTIVLLIVAVVIVLYATEKLPLSVTTILAMTAMAFFGILTPEESFSGFASTATLLLIGMSIVGEAFFTSGLVVRFGGVLIKLTKIPRSVFLALMFLIGALLSAFLNGLAVVAIFMPILAGLEERSKGEIEVKHTLMPLAIGAVLGGNLSVVGSTSMINASNLLGESYYGKQFEFFAPAAVAAPMVLAVFVFYLLVGEKLQRKCFDFEGRKPEAEEPSEDGKLPPVWKSVLVLAVLGFCIVGFAVGGNLILVSFIGALLVIISGSITAKRAYKGISWETIFVIAGATSFSKGIMVSGAGEIIADAVISIFGPAVEQPFGFCLVILILSTVLSNFMSNNVSVTIIAPIALSVAQQLGYDPLPLMLACGVGVNLSLATPICTACITMTTKAGYRFKDYTKVGGAVNLLAVVVTAIAFYVIYYA